MKTAEGLIGKKVNFFGANFNNRILQEGVVVDIKDTPYRYGYSDVVLDNGFIWSLDNDSIKMLLRNGVIGDSVVIIGDPMKITIIQ